MTTPILPQAPSQTPSQTPSQLLPTPTPAPATVTTTVTTSRDWILPARPKPGRKPSTQIPPTKRKAQNREAQRAFRERKQARVAELECALRELQIEHAKKVVDLEGVLVRCRGERDHYRDLARAMFSPSPSSLHEDHGSTNDRMGVNVNTTNTMNEVMNTEWNGGLVGQSVPLRRNRLDTHFTTDGRGEHKRPKLMRFSQSDTTNHGHHPPPPPPPPPLHPSSSSPLPFISAATSAPSVRDREIDFTTPAATDSGERVNYRSVENCGFCSEGTPCVCAEAVAATIIEDLRTSSTSTSTLTPASGLVSHGRSGPLDVSTTYRPRQYLPLPISVHDNNLHDQENRGDRTSPTTRVFASTNASDGPGCTGKPGSCGQCEMDPMSTLFCKTLAANSIPSSSSSSSPSPSSSSLSASSAMGNTSINANMSRGTIRDGYDKANHGQAGMRQLLPRLDHQSQRQDGGRGGAGAGGGAMTRHHRTRSDSAMETTLFRKSLQSSESSTLIPSPSISTCSSINTNSSHPSPPHPGTAGATLLVPPRNYIGLGTHPYGSTPCPSGYAMQPPSLPSPCTPSPSQSPSQSQFQFQSQAQSQAQSQSQAQATTETYLPCSAVYQTLSRHQGFGRADLGLLVRDLKVNRGLGVEVGSVRDVLRLLDRNLGRDS